MSDNKIISVPITDFDLHNKAIQNVNETLEQGYEVKTTLGVGAFVLFVLELNPAVKRTKIHKLKKEE